MSNKLTKQNERDLEGFMSVAQKGDARTMPSFLNCLGELVYTTDKEGKVIIKKAIETALDSIIKIAIKEISLPPLPKVIQNRTQTELSRYAETIKIMITKMIRDQMDSNMKPTKQQERDSRQVPGPLNMNVVQADVRHAHVEHLLNRNRLR